MPSRKIILLLVMITVSLVVYRSIFPARDDRELQTAEIKKNSSLSGGPGNELQSHSEGNAHHLTENFPPSRLGRTGPVTRISSPKSTRIRSDEIVLIQKEITEAIEARNPALLELLLRSLSAKGVEAVPTFLELLQRYPDMNRIEFYLGKVQDKTSFHLFRQVYEASQNESVQRSLLRLMGTNPHPDATEYLVQQLDSSVSKSLENALIYALGFRKDQKAVAALLGLLDRPHSGSSLQTIVEALIWAEASSASGKLLDLVQHAPDRQTIFYALGGLARLGDETAASQLLELLPRLTEYSMQRSAYPALGEMLGNKGMSLLMDLSDSAVGKELNLPAPIDIAFMDSDEIYNLAVSLLKNGQMTDGYHLATMIKYLGESGKQGAGDVLRSLYNDKARQVNRLELIQAIGSIPSPENLQFLNSLFSVQTPEHVRWSAINALKDNFGEQAIPSLTKEIQSGGVLAVVAFDALAEIGGPEAETILDTFHKNVAISSVIHGSQAENMGLQSGDIIRAYNRHEVTSAADLQEIVSTISPLEPVELEIERNGEYLTYVIDGGSIGVYMQEFIGSDR